jgi:competence/damage-inducible protein CinA-like protein
MLPTAEIFSQGEEVVTGQTLDSNAAWLSQRLVQMGFRVTRHTAVGDKLDDLIALLREVAARTDCCICTGGLGPTCDDLTAEAVSKAFRLPLQFDPEAYRQIERFFALRNRVMPEVNRKQALLPQGAARLDNEWGTAPGFALQAGRCRFAFAPGVPYEMRQMFDAHVRPILTANFSLRPAKLVTIKAVGIGESDIQQRIENIVIPGDVRLGFRAGAEDVQTKLLFPPAYPDDQMRALVCDIAARIGGAVFAVDFDGSQSLDLAAAVDALLQGQTQTLAIAETISQGLIAAKCIGYPWLLESVYADTRQRLCRKLDVADQGEPPAETAQRLAKALRDNSGADLALLQLYTGEVGALHDKDKSISLYHALASADGVYHGAVSVGGPLKRKQNQAALLALDFLRRNLLGRE